MVRTRREVSLALRPVNANVDDTIGEVLRRKQRKRQQQISRNWTIRWKLRKLDVSGKRKVETRKIPRAAEGGY